MIETQKLNFKNFSILVVGFECFSFSGFLEGVLGVGIRFWVGVQLIIVLSFVAVNVEPVIASEVFLAKNKNKIYKLKMWFQKLKHYFKVS